MYTELNRSSPYIDEALISFTELFLKAIVKLSLQMQLIKSEAFETVSVCQCDSGSNNKATASLARSGLQDLAEL